ncbi:MAG: hypothetical protein ACR2PT_11960 [Endozoicomonas sp.]
MNIFSVNGQAGMDHETILKNIADLKAKAAINKDSQKYRRHHENIAIREIKKSFSNDKLLARMLVRYIPKYTTNMSALPREIDELAVNEIILSSSTSLLTSQKGAVLFTNVGFLLDSSKLKVRAVFSGNANTRRVNSEGRAVIWDDSFKTFLQKASPADCENPGACSCYFYPGFGDGCLSDYDGGFIWKETASAKKIRSFEYLASYLYSWSLEWGI